MRVDHIASVHRRVLDLVVDFLRLVVDEAAVVDARLVAHGVAVVAIVCCRVANLALALSPAELAETCTTNGILF